MTSGRIAGLVVAALCVVCSAQTAGAGESGSFELLETHVHDYTTLEHAGQTITGGSLRGTGTIIESSGGLFANGENYTMTCVVYARKSETGIDLEVPCVMVDSTGDELYLLAERRAGDLEAGGGGHGSQQIVGGTGAYAGVIGDCPYTTSYLPENWLVSRGICTWQRP